MSNNLSTFQKFADITAAKEFAALLEQENIYYEIADYNKLSDISYVKTTFTLNIYIKIKEEDFEKADKLYKKTYDESFNDIDPNYYLFDFTNDELFNILKEPDKWGKFDYTLAQKILKEKGMLASNDIVKELYENRMTELAKPEKASRFSILLGCTFSVLGGFIGIIISWSIAYSKKELPNGKKVFTYIKQDRKRAEIILIISFITTTIIILLKLAALLQIL